MWEALPNRPQLRHCSTLLSMTRVQIVKAITAAATSPDKWSKLGHQPEGPIGIAWSDFLPDDLHPIAIEGIQMNPVLQGRQMRYIVHIVNTLFRIVTHHE